MKRVFWVSRSRGSGYVHVWLRASAGKPHLNPDTGTFAYSMGTNDSTALCYTEFHRAFGITIKPEECVRVAFTATLSKENAKAKPKEKPKAKAKAKK